MGIINKALNIAAATVFLGAVNPAVNIANQVGYGASVPVQVQELADRVHDFADALIVQSGLPSGLPGLEIGPDLQPIGEVEFGQ